MKRPNCYRRVNKWAYHNVLTWASVEWMGDEDGDYRIGVFSS